MILFATAKASFTFLNQCYEVKKITSLEMRIFVKRLESVHVRVQGCWNLHCPVCRYGVGAGWEILCVGNWMLSQSTWT